MPVVATKPAPVAARTEYREKQKALPVSRRRKRRHSVIVARSVICTLGAIFAFGYIGLYGQVMIYGYHKAEVAKQMRQAKTENQALRAEVQILSSPDRLAAVAVSGGMQPAKEVLYITTPANVNVAKAN